MTLVFLTSQLAVIITVAVTLLLTLLLAAIITIRYFQKKGRSLLFWSLGIWCFVVGVFLELLFALGVYPNYLIAFYLFIVGVLVELLALGSIQFSPSKRVRQTYYVFVIITTIFLLWSVYSAPVCNSSSCSNMISYYTVWANPSPLVVVTSSLVTFPAALILIYYAAKSYIAKRNKRLLGIILGVIIVSIAGTLYLEEYPAFLYIAEFVGILLLWYGFI